MPYKHGIYGEQIPTTDTLPPSGVSTLPVYIGTAPIQQLADPTAAINIPILVNSFDDAKAKLGYSDDWATFTLCEVMYAHFKNPIRNIGPIVLINVMDPLVHKSADTASVAITNGVGYLNAPAILSSIVITGKVLDTDYSLEYTSDGQVKIAELTALDNPSTVDFDKMDVSLVQDTDIIGGNTNGVRTGISVVDLIYQTQNMIPTILGAPGWSQTPTIKTALASESQAINGHWDALVVADIDSSATTDIATAKTWKDTNGYIDTNMKLGWPKAKISDKTYFASTLMAVRMQQTDYDNDNVPYESPSNKPIGISSLVLADGTAISFDEVEANDLNSAGITTFNFRGGIWVLWGPHNANYVYGASIDPKDEFDASIRMMMYLTNTFQENYMSNVDGPLNRSVIDTILNGANTWLNGLVADGKLLSGSISFNETSNPISSIVEGDFVFDVLTTTTPVAKSLTFKVQYTTQGTNALFGGGA